MNESDSPHYLHRDDADMGAKIQELIMAGMPPSEAEAVVRGDTIETPPPDSPKEYDDTPLTTSELKDDNPDDLGRYVA